MANLRYGLYARKSSESQERQVLSIESQVRKAEEMFPGLHVARVVIEHHSAFEPGKRPEFQRLLADIDAGKLDGIIAWHPDRLSRNEEDAAKITYRVRKGVIKDLKFCSYNFDNSPEGIMMLQLALSQSQYFSSKLSKDVKRGFETKLHLGWRPGMPMIGYLNERVARTIITDPDRFELVRRMWDYLLTGQYSPPRILDIATEEWGLTTVKRGRIGGGPLARSAIYKVFSHPFYAGFIRHNGQLHKGSHQPMVTVEEFRTAQAILARTMRNRQRKPIRFQFAYTGLINCEECGCLYTASEHKGLVYYHCTRRKRSVECGQRKYIREDRLEAMFLQAMQGCTIHPTLRKWAHDYLDRVATAEEKQAVAIQDARQQKIATLRKQLNGLIDMRAINLLSDEDFVTRRDELKIEIVNLEEQLLLANDRVKEVLDRTRQVFDLLTYGEAVLRHGSIRKKLAVIHGLTKCRTAANGKLSVELQDWVVPIADLHQVPGYPYARRGWWQPKADRASTSLATARYSEAYGSRWVGTANVLQNNSMTGVENNKAADVAALMSLWCRTVDEVRAAINQNLPEVNLPKFDALGDVILKEHKQAEANPHKSLTYTIKCPPRLRQKRTGQAGEAA